MIERKESIRRAFARAAATYDQAALVQQAVVRQLVEFLPPKSVSRILEIGCGTGNLTARLSHHSPQAEMVALDFCEEMIAAAKQKVPSTQIRWEVADGEWFVPANAHFDLITSSGAFQWFDDLPAALGRYANWLNPRGWLLFAIFGPQTFCELQTVWQRVRSEDTPLPAASFFPEVRLQACLQQHFGQVDIQPREYQFQHATFLELLRHLRATGTNGANRPPMTRGTIQALEGEYLAEYGEIRTTYEVFFCQARLIDSPKSPSE